MRKIIGYVRIPCEILINKDEVKISLPNLASYKTYVIEMIDDV